jgi:uncharacterized protein YbjQ (UPF0145 family)
VVDAVWDGLPPRAARVRIARAAAGGARTSLLTIGGAAGLRAAGFEVAGEVLGATVMRIGWTGLGDCGWSPASRMAGPPRSGYAPYVAAVRKGRDTALGRLEQEAGAIGADGVVGIRLTDEPLAGGMRQFTASGTAVRSPGTERPARPFTTDLGGADIAKLLDAGWVPVGLAYGLSVAVGHDDWRAQNSLGYFVPYTELVSCTALLNHVRAEARRDFARATARLGGDGALLSDLWSHVRRSQAGETHIDHVAECLVSGNAIARFGLGRTTIGSRTILPLGGS